MPYKERHVEVEDAFVKGTLISEGNIKLEIVTYRKQRDDTYEETHSYVHVDLHSIICVRDTMRKLAKAGLTERARVTKSLENWLANPHQG